MAGWYMQVCDVCRLLDGDRRQKLCAYCPICDAWICVQDVSNWGRRGRASALAMAERFNA
jgi:hypothetical protein